MTRLLRAKSFVLAALLLAPGCGAEIDPGGHDGSGPVEVTYDLTTWEAPQVDPEDPENANKDSDCDGLSDEEEFSIAYPDGKKTDPANPDSDGDGVLDGVEAGKTSSVAKGCAFTGDADPMTKTLPTSADTDGDGIKDGLEDKNKNGKADPGETDPTKDDSDGDGIKDGDEDKNKNGKADPGETDPTKADTDGDKISDGVEVNVTMTDPTKADTDGDGCNDGDEDSNQNGKVDPGETDPKVKDCGASGAKDTDKDGLPDTIEDANGNGMFDPGETDLNDPDTDKDGLPDGLEDANKNGQVDGGETNPRRKDSDCDGLLDGPDQGGALGEDVDKNGKVDPGETDPRKFDSDGDGLRDGIERGVTQNPDATGCPGFVGDADPATKTDPTKPDSDGDGIDDGSEDANQNGKVDAGELDPGNATDGTGPVAKACKTSNLVPIVFRDEVGADVQVALPKTFTELETITVGGKTRGLIGYDDTAKVAFVAYRATPGGADPTADEAALRPAINGVGALSNAVVQGFTSWDGFAAASAFYDMAGGTDLKSQANALANALVGAGGGALKGAGGGNGPFKVQAELVHRSAQSLAVIIALTPAGQYVEPTIFTVGDLGGGSALAQFGDASATQCERFVPKGGGAVDFLFVVDDSGSMANSQTALASTGAAMSTALNNTTIDWRIALVTTSYATSGTNKGILRGFTRNIEEFKGWLTQSNTCSGGFCSKSNKQVACTSNANCWVGTSGSGHENCLESGALAVSNLTPGTAQEQKTKIRSGATLLMIILGDADDQSSYSASQYIKFYGTPGSSVGSSKNNASSPVVVHGIVCPAGKSCNGETQNNPQKHGLVIAALKGVRGDISTPASITATMDQVVKSVIGAAGHKTLKPPIGASIKVAMDAVSDGAKCNADDLPRSRVNGFDFDGMNRTLSFFGACRPAMTAMTAAVSYRYWIDTTPRPDGNPPPCSSDPYYDATDPDFCRGRLVCNKATNVCECPPDCGGMAPAGKVCNTNKMVCDFVCTPDCGGSCSAYQTCETTACVCQCKSTATCPPGFVFTNSGDKCGCFCDTAALKCGPTYNADAKSCACVCKPDCGGCPSGQSCNLSKCQCGGIG